MPHPAGDFIHALDTACQRFARPEHRRMTLHGMLHVKTKLRHCLAAIRMAHPVKSVERFISSRLRRLRQRCASCHCFAGPMRGGAAKHHNIKQRIGAKPVRPMYRYTGRFTNRHKPRHHSIFVRLGWG